MVVWVVVAISLLLSCEHHVDTPTRPTIHNGTAVRVKFIVGEAGDERLIVENGSRNLLSLPYPPTGLDERCKNGKVVVYVCGLWNPTEIGGVRIASSVADLLPDDGVVAVQPIAKYEEITSFYSAYDISVSPLSPIWVAYFDGKPVGELRAEYEVDRVLEWAKKAFRQ